MCDYSRLLLADIFILRWRFDLVVTLLGTATKLPLIDRGYYWDGWPFSSI